jgi:hypothetical protein
MGCLIFTNEQKLIKEMQFNNFQEITNLATVVYVKTHIPTECIDTHAHAHAHTHIEGSNYYIFITSAATLVHNLSSSVFLETCDCF